MQRSIPLRFPGLILLSLLAVSGCTKQGPQGPAGPQGPQGPQGAQGQQGVAPTPSIAGYWTGDWGVGLTSYPTEVYNFLFRNDGTVRIYENADTTGGAYGEGTYTLHGDTVKGTYNTGLFSFTAVVDVDFTFMQGYWGTSVTPQSGLFFAAK